jgi:hypothetical protein
VGLNDERPLTDVNVGEKDSFLSWSPYEEEVKEGMCSTADMLRDWLWGIEQLDQLEQLQPLFHCEVC